MNGSICRSSAEFSRLLSTRFLTRVLTLVEGGKDAQSPEHRRVLVDDGGADQGGRALAAVDRRQAAHGLAQEVLSRPLLYGPSVPYPRGSSTRCQASPRRLFVAEAQALHGARPVILDDDVGIADQTPHDLLSPLGAQVHAQAALVAPAEEEEDANPVQIRLSPDQCRSQAPLVGSIFTTSAPRSARIWTAEGPAGSV